MSLGKLLMLLITFNFYMLMLFNSSNKVTLSSALRLVKS
jgi:hypothetical protein